MMLLVNMVVGQVSVGLAVIGARDFSSATATSLFLYDDYKTVTQASAVVMRTDWIPSACPVSSSLPHDCRYLQTLLLVWASLVNPEYEIT